MSGRDLLDLLRIPNVFTAVSDVAAATAVVSASASVGWAATFCAAGASAALYCAGMALNDVADAATDAIERPTRPIPSGRVRRAEAIGVASTLMLAGLALAWAASPATLAVAALLLAAILLYDLQLAGRPILGPTAMASCRALNLLLGLTAAGEVTGAGSLALAVWFVYVFGLTHLSLGEVSGSARLAVAIAALTTLSALLALIGLARHHGLGRAWWGWLAFGLSLLPYAFGVAPALARALANPRPAQVGAAVGALVGGIVWLGCGLATAVAASWWLFVFLALFGAHALLRRSFRVT